MQIFFNQRIDKANKKKLNIMLYKNYERYLNNKKKFNQIPWKL